MAKPKNFPERKRQRQLGALARIASTTAGKPDKGIAPKPNNREIARLHALTADSKRSVRTKKNRTARARFAA